MAERKPGQPLIDLDTFQQRIGYRFRDQSLIRRALTHPSAPNEYPDDLGDNQRLEFLGDAVLDFIAGAWVYRHYPEFDEGRLTRLRAALVRTQTLARFARQAGIHEALRMGRGEEEAGGRSREASLADAFEAVSGALFLDGGLEAAAAFIEPFISSTAEAILEAEADQDPKSRFQEWSQAELGITPHYRIVTERGPDHAKMFVAEVLLDGRVVGRGSGHSKQAAEQAAAEEALAKVAAEPSPE